MVDVSKVALTILSGHVTSGGSVSKREDEGSENRIIAIVLNIFTS